MKTTIKKELEQAEKSDGSDGSDQERARVEKSDGSGSASRSLTAIRRAPALSRAPAPASTSSSPAEQIRALSPSWSEQEHLLSLLSGSKLLKIWASVQQSQPLIGSEQRACLWPRTRCILPPLVEKSDNWCALLHWNIALNAVALEHCIAADQELQQQVTWWPAVSCLTTCDGELDT